MEGADNTLSTPQWHHRWPAVIVERRTTEASAFLQRYYAITINGQPAYSGSQFEAIAALNTDPNSIGPADLTAVTMLSVKVRPHAVIRLLIRDATAISRLLEQMPLDQDIVDASADQLTTGSPGSELWSLLRRGRDGLGPTTTSKLIAAKRPRFAPIWDSFVEEATGLTTIDYWREIRSVLIYEDRSIWNWIDNLRRSQPGLPSGVSNLRLLDILLWMSVHTRESRVPL